MKRTRYFCVALLIIFISSALFFVSAETNSNAVDIVSEEIGTIDVINEIPIHDNMNFTISDTCSVHAYFDQLFVRKDGAFIVYSEFVSLKGVSRETFRKKFVDIYDSNGNFVQEISFVIPYNFSVELTDETINFYSDYYMMVYELDKTELKSYSVKNDINTSNEIYRMQRENDFICGEWEYKSHRNFMGEYVKITRTKGDIVQTLVEMPGTVHKFPWGGIIVGGLVGIFGVVTIIFITMRKKKQKI